MGLGMGELLLILAIVLLVFGPTKLPALASGLGKALRSFKNATNAPDAPETLTPKNPND